LFGVALHVGALLPRGFVAFWVVLVFFWVCLFLRSSWFGNVVSVLVGVRFACSSLIIFGW
jgi:hypothetical protein